MLESVVMRPRQLINLDTIIQKSLLFYRSKKPQPTNRCVINGVSCSQRFEKTFNQKMADEKTAVKALSNALDETAHKCAEINNVKTKIKFVNGDIKKVALKLKEENKKFDFIVMPRPNLKESFLEQTFMLSKKGTFVYYYDFCKVDETNLIVDKIKKQAEKFKKKIKILNVKPAGEIAPYKIRVRVDFEVLG